MTFPPYCFIRNHQIRRARGSHTETLNSAKMERHRKILVDWWLNWAKPVCGWWNWL